MVAYVFLTSVSTPYRQDLNLFLLKSPIGENSQIVQPSVSTPTSKTIHDLKGIFDRVRPEIRKPLSIIDLTGQSPGLIFAAGGKTVGQPWLAGGYGGSESAMRWVLKSLNPCDRVNSLILVEEHGLRSLPTGVLSGGGWNFDRDYKLLGRVKIEAGTGFFGEHRIIELFELKDSTVSKFAHCF